MDDGDSLRLPILHHHHHLENVDLEAGPPLPPDISPNDPPPPYLDTGLRSGTVMQSRRYNQHPTITMAHRFIEPGTFAFRDYAEDRTLPPEWVQFIHPEGKAYFYHPRLRIVTEAWIYSPPVLSQVVHFANQFFGQVQQRSIRLPPTYELLLELENDEEGGGGGCMYYLVDHVRRTEFWIDTTTTDELGIPASSSTAHLKLHLQHHYWQHVEYFPVHVQLSDDVETELQGILLHATADAMTSDLSTAPLAPDKCRTYLRLLQDLHTSAVSRGYKNCVVARLWGEFARNRYINLHGEENARLCRDQMLSPDPEQETSSILNAANYLLFSVPETHLSNLKKLFVDDIAYTEHWQKFIKRMIWEWQESVLWSLIILITELILFMHLSMSEKPEINIWTSFQHACALVAIILASGSALTGVILTRHHKHLADTHAAEAVSTTTFLESHRHPTLGMRPLATLYALPYGFLTWSIIALVMALMLLATTLTNKLTQALLWIFCLCAAGVMLVMVGLLGRWRGIRVMRRRITEGRLGRWWRWFRRM